MPRLPNHINEIVVNILNEANVFEELIKAFDVVGFNLRVSATKCAVAVRITDNDTLASSLPEGFVFPFEASVWFDFFKLSD